MRKLLLIVCAVVVLTPVWRHFKRLYYQDSAARCAAYGEAYERPYKYQETIDLCYLECRPGIWTDSRVVGPTCP